jgi:ADP-heptose:LPS heptosyltransferase
MEQKAKKTGRFRRWVLKIAGPKRTIGILTYSLTHRYKVPGFSLPDNVETAKTILLIVPSTTLDAVHQIGTMLSFVSSFRQAKVILLCDTTVAPVARNLPGVEIVEYELQDCLLFSKQMTGLANLFHNTVDICVVLDHAPALPILYLAGQTCAPVRAGYGEAGSFPFLNYRVNPTGTYIADWNMALARFLGAKPMAKIKWSVKKESLEEIRHSLHESGIRQGGPLIGLDLFYLDRTYGRTWTENLVASLEKIAPHSMYICSGDTTGGVSGAWDQRFGARIYQGLSISKLAALISCSHLIIAGNSTLFALSALLEVPLIGLFNTADFPRYCPRSPRITAVTFDGEPDLGSIDAVAGTVRKLTTPAAARIPN